MSIKTKKRFKNLGKIVGAILFALILFTNMKVALTENSESTSQDISLLGIELTLFDATFATEPSCTVRTTCMDGGFVQCTSPNNDCERDSGVSVTCDGTTTYC